jgi:hypothetical protein
MNTLSGMPPVYYSDLFTRHYEGVYMLIYTIKIYLTLIWSAAAKQEAKAMWESMGSLLAFDRKNFKPALDLFVKF